MEKKNIHSFPHSSHPDVSLDALEFLRDLFFLLHREIQKKKKKERSGSQMGIGIHFVPVTYYPNRSTGSVRWIYMILLNKLDSKYVERIFLVL